MKAANQYMWHWFQQPTTLPLRLHKSSNPVWTRLALHSKILLWDVTDTGPLQGIVWHWADCFYTVWSRSLEKVNSAQHKDWELQWLLPSFLRTETGLSEASELAEFSETWWDPVQNIPWHWLPYWPLRPRTWANTDVIKKKTLRIVNNVSVWVFLCKRRCFNLHQQ